MSVKRDFGTVDNVKAVISAGRTEEAIAHLEKRALTDPDNLNVWRTYYGLMTKLGRIDEMTETFCHCMRMVQDPESIFFDLASQLAEHAHPEAAMKILRALIKARPTAHKSAIHLLMITQYHEADDDVALRAYDEFNTHHMKHYGQLHNPAETRKVPDRTLRIGYVSRDFRGPVSSKWTLLPFFPDSSRSRHHQILYAEAYPRDDIHPRFLENADEIIDTVQYTDVELDERIRHDEIDILVDLTGPQRENRALVYTMKPAPIQVTWGGHGMAHGLETFDYCLADDTLFPPDVAHYYNEKLVYLPGSCVGWIPPEEAPDLVVPPYELNGHITFGVFTRFSKIRRESMRAWAAIMREVPGSRLLVKMHDLQHHSIDMMCALFAEEGIGRDCIAFLPSTNQFQQLAAYNKVDIVLDNFYLTSGVTAMEAFWMGVSVVTCRKSRRPAGLAASLYARLVGLGDLSTESTEDYIAAAIALANDRDRLAEIRIGLREAILRSPICAVDAYASDVTKAFEEMWRHYCAGEPPQSFRVADLHP